MHLLVTDSCPGRQSTASDCESAEEASRIHLNVRQVSASAMHSLSDGASPTTAMLRVSCRHVHSGSGHDCYSIQKTVEITV